MTYARRRGARSAADPKLRAGRRLTPRPRSGGSPREGARSELASAAATGGGGPQAPPTRIRASCIYRACAQDIRNADPTRTRTSLSAVRHPLHEPAFRALWSISLVSNLGTWAQTIGGAWLM